MAPDLASKSLPLKKQDNQAQAEGNIEQLATEVAEKGSQDKRGGPRKKRGCPQESVPGV